MAFAAMFGTLLNEEKVKHCSGCAIEHPSQKQHFCLMLYNEEASMYYCDDVAEKIDLNVMQKMAKSVYSALGLRSGKSWKAYVIVIVISVFDFVAG